MKKKIFLSILSIVLTVAAVFSCFAATLSLHTSNSSATLDESATADEPADAQNSDSALDIIYTSLPDCLHSITNISKKTYAKDSMSLKQGDIKFFELTNDEEATLLSFQSSDTRVITVDSGGRIDAIGAGTAKVTAEFSNNSAAECEVTVTSDGACNDTAPNMFSTCITGNEDILAKNQNSDNDKNLYLIKVNRTQNCVTVYTYDENGEYTVPVRAMVCSTGKNNQTITGTYGIYFKNEWHALFDNVYGQYVSGISGNYLFHSVPYYSPQPDELEVDEYNKLGTQASLGCVRLAVADAKWIFDNCPLNTTVTIYDDDNPGPLGKPKAIKITDKKCGWDPTDNNDKNPYNDKAPVIKGAKDCTVAQNSKFEPLKNIKALDTCSNDITDKVEIIGNVTTSRKGVYKVTYSVIDTLNRTATTDIYVTVK